MIFTQMKATLGKQLSQFSATRTVLMRNGKYTSGMNYNDGYAVMLFETIMELEETDNYLPLDKAKVRQLVGAFNRLTGMNVPDVWTDSV
jgi:hypothetical protein